MFYLNVLFFSTCLPPSTPETLPWANFLLLMSAHLGAGVWSQNSVPFHFTQSWAGKRTSGKRRDNWEERGVCSRLLQPRASQLNMLLKYIIRTRVYSRSLPTFWLTFVYLLLYPWLPCNLQWVRMSWKSSEPRSFQEFLTPWPLLKEDVQGKGIWPCV